ncbi:kinase-like domain-containing protein [Hyaloraphidium curvatum]|nr:kinase-like domain-containing protein [Hyaloraphidium curvatum]
MAATGSPTPSPPTRPPDEDPRLAHIQFHTNLLDEFLASDDGDADASEPDSLGRRRPSSVWGGTGRRKSLSPAVERSRRSLTHASMAELRERRHRLAVRLDFSNREITDAELHEAARKKADIVDLDDMFEVVRRLGSGMSGDVDLVRVRRGYYRRKRFPEPAEYVAPGTLYAMKTIPKAHVTDHAFLASLLNETFLQSELRHPNIAQLYDVLESYGEVYFIAEYCSGGDLLSHLRHLGTPLPIDHVRHVVRQILEALAYLHDRHVAHRDMKLQNVLVAGPEEEDEEEDRGRRGRDRSPSGSPRILPATRVEVDGTVLELPPVAIPPRSSSLSAVDGQGTDRARSASPGLTVSPATPPKGSNMRGSRSRSPRIAPKVQTFPEITFSEPSRRDSAGDDDPDASSPLSAARAATTPSDFLFPSSSPRPSSPRASSPAPSIALPGDTLRVKLTDFGFATVVPEPKAEGAEPEFRYGTPRYMAPEVVAPAMYSGFDGREADVWAVGVILFALVFEQFPFNGPTEEALEDHILNGDLVVPEGPRADPDAVDLLQLMLTRDPATRIASSAALLHPFLEQPTPSASALSAALRDIFVHNPLTRSLSGLVDESRKKRERNELRRAVGILGTQALDHWERHERRKSASRSPEGSGRGEDWEVG